MNTIVYVKIKFCSDRFRISFHNDKGERCGDVEEISINKLLTLYDMIQAKNAKLKQEYLNEIQGNLF